jgi:hypothetical protein
MTDNRSQHRRGCQLQLRLSATSLAKGRLTALCAFSSFQSVIWFIGFLAAYVAYALTDAFLWFWSKKMTKL